MRLAKADAEALEACLEACRAFFEQVGQPGTLSSLMDEKPPGPCTKEVLGVFEGNRLVGVADLLHGYPTPDVAFLGLLVLRPEVRGRGLGSAAEAALAERVRGRRLRLAVNFENPEGKAFWEARGYSVLAEAPLREAEDPTPTCWVMERRL